MGVGAIRAPVESAAAVRRGTNESNEYERKGRVEHTEERRAESPEGASSRRAARVAAETARRRESGGGEPSDYDKHGRVARAAQQSEGGARSERRSGRLVNVRG